MHTSNDTTSNDYVSEFTVDVPADTVRRAVSTAAGISAWWTHTTGSGAEGDEMRLTFSSDDPLVLRVDAARPTGITWHVTACAFMPDWVGTEPTFSIAPVGAERTAIRFRHVGLTPALECFDQCSAGWNHFVPSLRSYLESGAGNPFGSPADQQRRQVAV